MVLTDFLCQALARPLPASSDFTEQREPELWSQTAWVVGLCI